MHLSALDQWYSVIGRWNVLKYNLVELKWQENWRLGKRFEVKIFNGKELYCFNHGSE